MRFTPYVLAVIVAAASTSGYAAESANPPGQPATVATGLVRLEPAEKVTQRLAWWEDARFGMFIHWGLYSQWGCHYPDKNGNLLNGYSEHMMLRLRIPLAKYAKIADVFNPTCFDADQWVRIAKDAGMRYLVITAKHHDGFAMFDSPSSDYNIVKRTPFGRDVVKELAAACHREGLRFGVYYSLGRDWQDPDVPTKNGYRSNTWDYPDEAYKDFAKYFERKVKPQVRELLTQYGPIAVLWFDTPEEIAPAESKELMQLVHQLQPECIVNQRVGNRYGDYRVEEQNIPKSALHDPWETCMTLNRHWGYFYGDEDYKPASVVIRHLIDVVSKNGNFLLNVGPTGEGVIPPPAIADLRQVGRWLHVNGEAIYGAKGTSMEQPAWGRITQKTSRQGTTFYLHVFDWPANGQLVVQGLSQPVSTALLLATGSVLSTRRSNHDLIVSVPPQAPDAVSTTIVLNCR
ncbi:MAG TPA: alpha-L-fucosidase [Opitutaceae bacterium]|nr:alpha-L-fucosidase [Opitutaceae bacterium]